MSLWHFGLPFGSIVAPSVSILTHMRYSWESFGHFGETLGLHFGALGLHLGTLGVHVGVLWALWGVALDPSGHSCRKGSKNWQKGTQNHRIGEPSGVYFDDILSFCRKWQAAFGLRLRGRIRVGLLVLTLWASTCASTKNDCRSVGRGG